jgi:hypothetical protein
LQSEVRVRVSTARTTHDCNQSAGAITRSRGEAPATA